MKKLINWLFYGVCVLFPFGEIARLSFLGQQINAYAYELPLFLLLVALIILYKNKPFLDLIVKFPSLLIFLGYLILIYFLTSFFYTLQINLIGFLYLTRLLVYLFCFLYLQHHLQKYKEFVKYLQNGLMGMAVVTIIFSVAQYFLYPNLRNISYLGWDPHWYRMVGTFFDPPISGAIYGLFFIYFFKEKFKHLFVKYFLMTLLAISIFLTYSRGTFAAFFFISLFMFFKKKLLIGLATLVLLGGLVLIVIPKPFGESVNLLRTFSIYSRITNYQEALRDLSKQPVFGVGYNRIRYTRSTSDFQNQSDLENNHAGASYHSSFLVILVTGGVIGLLLFIWLLYSFTQLGTVALFSTIFLSLLSITDNVFLHPFVLLLYLFIVIRSSKAVNPSDSSR